MIFLRYESLRGYLKNYPVTVAISLMSLLLFVVAKLIGQSFYTSTIFIVVPGIDSWGLSEPWRYVTALFVHPNFAQLFHNLIILLVFAPPLEMIMKSRNYFMLCLASGVGANLFAALMSNINGAAHFSLGAHSIMYGIFGAYIYIAIFRKMFLDSGSIKAIYIIVAINVVSLFLFNQRYDIWGHIGGFVIGFMLYRFFDYMQIMKLQKRDHVK